jgi:hypothetical protein
MITDFQSHVLKAKVSKSDPDNPSWSQAINSADADKWWATMSAEMENLEVDLQAWNLSSMNMAKFKIPIGILQNSECCQKLLLLPTRPEPHSNVGRM